MSTQERFDLAEQYGHNLFVLLDRLSAPFLSNALGLAGHFPFSRGETLFTFSPVEVNDELAKVRTLEEEIRKDNGGNLPQFYTGQDSTLPYVARMGLVGYQLRSISTLRELGQGEEHRAFEHFQLHGAELRHFACDAPELDAPEVLAAYHEVLFGMPIADVWPGPPDPLEDLARYMAETGAPYAASVTFKRVIDPIYQR